MISCCRCPNSQNFLTRCLNLYRYTSYHCFPVMTYFANYLPVSRATLELCVSGYGARLTLMAPMWVVVGNRKGISPEKGSLCMWACPMLCDKRVHDVNKLLLLPLLLLWCYSPQNNIMSAGLVVVIIWLELCMSQLQLSPPPPSSLAPIKSGIETSWYRLTQVHVENGY